MTERILITGATGQLGRALAEKYQEATALDRASLDISDASQVDSVDWSQFDIILNAAAYVNADEAQTPEGRRRAWAANAVGPKNLAKVAIDNGIHLIHFSSEYVFDGQTENHDEGENYSPLQVYGQTKSAGDIAVGLVEKHHILRTSWVVGDGHNFVKTMTRLADMRIDPFVVDDQFGRLTFTSELVRAVDHLISRDIETGTYNLSNTGVVRSWAEIAAMTFDKAGHDDRRVRPISTDEYVEKIKPGMAPRPRSSDLDLSKIRATGFKSNDYEDLLGEYIGTLERVK